MTETTRIVDLRVGSYSQASLLSIECLTPLHVGAGRRSAGYPVDLPIQRDAFEFPMISGSSLKGPIRSFFKKKNPTEDTAAFGSDSQEDSGLEYYAGAVLVLDARLLTIPVRSLKGIYVNGTCPYMLSNFATYAEACKDSERAGKLKKLLSELPNLEGRHIAMTQDASKEVSLNLKSGSSVILGDDGKYKVDPSEVVGEIAEEIGSSQKKLAICHDNDMHEHILKRAIIVTQRIKIKQDTKTVSPGGLWSEENVPQKTRFATALFYSDSRKPGAQKSAKEIKASLDDVLMENRTIIFGGDETVGRGLCKVTIF